MSLVAEPDRNSRVKKIIFVTDQVGSTAVGGREQLGKSILSVMSQMDDLEVEEFVLAEDVDRGFGPVVRRLAGYVNGATKGSIALLIDLVRTRQADAVWLNGSNLGRIAQALRAARPSTEILTFFHNCEARFFLGALRQRPSIRAVGVLVANAIAERLAVIHSDVRICLSERDSRMLRSLYGQGGSHILPMALEDQLEQGIDVSRAPPVQKYALFVGGSFYANRQGMEWYADNVAARAAMKVCVVGKGFESWKDRLEKNGNVEVIGRVDDLRPWYLDAQVVIAPIFDGSGMKTKIGEALMFGKRVLGTEEAFSGYESLVGVAGECCTTADQYVDALSREAERAHVTIDWRLRSIYLNQYSFEAAQRRLRGILRLDGASCQ